MFYSAGRVYYTRSGNSHMFWRWFEPDSGVMGADEFTTTDGMNWSHVAGAFLNGSTLYYADSTTKSLFSVPFVNGQALGTPTIVNSSINWTSAGAFVASTNAVNGPPAPAAFTASCTGLTCSFDASASVDPGGTITGYDWTWGDGAAANDTTPTDSHSYATGGAYTVTLTVVGSDGTTSSTTQTVNPVGSAPITFQGATAYDGSAGSATATVPGTAQAGDQLLLFETYASTSVTATAPAGWTVVGTATAPNLTTAVYARTAQASDAGTAVSVNFSATVKASLTVADYAGAAGGVEASAFAKDTNTASHITPTVAGLTDGSLALSFWGDKSTGTTAWTPPAAVTSRASDYGVGGGAVSALLADSGSAVSGGYGGLTATTNAKSGTGVEWTVALSNTDPS
jgi:PKD repeat protein